MNIESGQGQYGEPPSGPGRGNNGGRGGLRFRSSVKAKPAAGPKPVPNPFGRAGNPAHQADVLANAKQDTGLMNPKTVGNRVPDNVGDKGQKTKHRGTPVDPGPEAQVMHESGTARKDGIPTSDERAQLRDMRKTAPENPMVFTDYKRPEAPAVVYPPGSQPPPPGRLPPNSPAMVPAVTPSVTKVNEVPEAAESQ